MWKGCVIGDDDDGDIRFCMNIWKNRVPCPHTPLVVLLARYVSSAWGGMREGRTSRMPTRADDACCRYRAQCGSCGHGTGRFRAFVQIPNEASPTFVYANTFLNVSTANFTSASR